VEPAVTPVCARSWRQASVAELRTCSGPATAVGGAPRRRRVLVDGCHAGTRPMAHQQQRPCLVLYGSATGNSEEIARAISEDAANYGIEAQYACLDQFKKGELTAGSVCVFVVSTTGEGEAPENASRFMRTIKRKTQKPTMFEGISFTCCGLGDTNYSMFCNTGKLLNKRMCELGAEKFYAECEADEGVGGLEQFIEPWTAGLWKPLRIALGMDDAAKEPAATEATEPAPVEATEPAPAEQTGGAAAAPIAVPTAAAAPPTRLALEPVAEAPADAVAVARQATASHSGASLFSATPTAARQLTADDAEKTVWHMQLDVSAVRKPHAHALARLCQHAVVLTASALHCSTPSNTLSGTIVPLPTGWSG
jgi:sulfite reductase alpha subunit-like flavoprotein